MARVVCGVAYGVRLLLCWLSVDVCGEMGSFRKFCLDAVPSSVLMKSHRLDVGPRFSCFFGAGIGV